MFVIQGAVLATVPRVFLYFIVFSFIFVNFCSFNHHIHIHYLLRLWIRCKSVPRKFLGFVFEFNEFFAAKKFDNLFQVSIENTASFTYHSKLVYHNTQKDYVEFVEFSPFLTATFMLIVSESLH